ncbi:MAG: histidinol-phosphate transaminase [Actinomycetota bacterium]
MIGRPRPAVSALPAYRPGRSAEMAEREHDITDAIKLASNELPFGPLPSVTAAIAAAAAETHLYADHRAEALRAELATRNGVAADQVMVGAGSVGLLQQLALTYLDPGDRVLFGWPSFEAYPVFAALVGAEVVRVPLVDHTNDLAAHADAIDDRTKLVMIANPNNPTGTAVGLGDVATLLDRVPPDCLVVLDEAYREFVTMESLGDPMPLLAEHPNLIILRTFSKAHGLASLRVGYGFAHPEVVTEIDKTLVPFIVNGVGQAAALASLAARDEMGDRVHQVVLERSRVIARLAELGHEVPDAQANFVWLPNGEEAAPLAERLERAGVVTRGFAGAGVRVTISTPEHNDRFLAALSS